MPDTGDMADIGGPPTARPDTGPDSATRRSGEDLQWKNSGHDSGPSPGELRPVRPSFPQPATPRHGDAPIGPQDAAHASREHACRSCPYAFASLERDMIQFVVVDQSFRDLLLQQAAVQGWRVKERARAIYLYLPHLTLQLGADSVTFYSDEPEELDWIAAWVRQHFADCHPDIEALVARIRRPEHLARDELTVVIEDAGIIDAVVGTIGMQMKKNVMYLKAPNTTTPGFKTYLHEGTLRCEFDARNQVQAISALAMRQRLLTILPEVRNHPGLFWEFLTDYYNPYMHPIIIDTGMDEVLAQVRMMGETMAQAFLEGVRELAAGERRTAPSAIDAAVEKVNHLIYAIPQDDGWDLDAVADRFTATFGCDRTAALVFLAAWGTWTQRRFRGPVLKEDVAARLAGSDGGVDVGSGAIDRALATLTEIGLLEPDAYLDVRFSKAGVRLGKKLLARWEG